MYNSDDGRGRVLWACVVAVVTVGLIVLLAVSSLDKGSAERAVESAGFTDAQVIESGYITLRCGEDDDAMYYRVRAINPHGEKVTMTVCCGVFKDCTVRF